MRKKLRKFRDKLAHGLKQEYHETKEIPKHIKNKEYKKAAQQLCDIGKMTFLSLLWILPGGGVMSAALVKFSHKFRPSAFREEKKDRDRD